MGNRGIAVTFTVTLLIFCSSLLQHVESEDILVFGAVGSHSTRISMFPFMEALAEKGHKVTFLSPYDNFEDPDKKSKIIYYTPEKWKQAMGGWEDFSSTLFDARKQGLNQQMWLDFLDEGIRACENLYSDPEFVNWVKTAKYDLVIMESAMNDCAFGLVHMFKTKLVVYGTSTLFPWFSDSYGFPDESSSVPDASFDFPPGNRMTFWQRVQNAVSPIIFSIKRDYSYFPVLEEITRKGLGLSKDELPSFREIEQNVSLILLTSHITTDLPRSFPPHVIPIGGAVVGGKPKPMSKEMEEFVNSAKSGFVYISFGTGAEFAKFNRDTKLEFIQALRSFPEMKFLWKSRLDLNETLPDNVMVTKWAPQQTVLAHPKIKAFISHGGMGSVTESVKFGIQLVLFPLCADQDVNANAIESKGAGIKLEITTLKTQELVHALSEVLHNSKYRESMKKLSASFKDRPVQPIESGVWWIEYILRHPNSNDYLVPLSVRQPWWKRRQLDVWLTLGACLAVGLTVSLAVILFLVKKLVVMIVFSGGNSNVKLAKKKNQ